jgi:heavy metal translocating P-type ATPase
VSAGDATAARSCAHCGLPARARSGAEEAFCCSGCFLVHRLSHRGLEASTDRLLGRVVLGAFLAMGVMVFSLALYGRFLHTSEASDGARALTGLFRLGALSFSTPALVLLGLPLFDAVVSLRRFLSAEALILVGTAAAWAVSVWNTFTDGGEVYFDTATMVLLLASFGRWLDARSRERATAELVRLLPEREADAARLDPAGGETAVRVADLEPGDLLRVRPGEVVPVDGTVVTGRSFADAAALTGESTPQSFGPGDRVHAGATLVDGSLVVRASATVGHRMRDEIERLLREALAERPRWVRVADRLAGAFLPGVILLAGATVAWRWRLVGPEHAWLDGLSVVLISCPCALGIATPLAFWSAIGAAWKRGVLVRGGETLEALARVRRVFLDKTGTLTSGELELVALEPRPGVDAGEALRLAAALEVGSEHPIARSLRAAWRARSAEPLPEVAGFRALPGVGVEGALGGRRLALTRDVRAEADETTRIVLAADGEPLARLAFRAVARSEAPWVVAELARAGLRVAVLTGDGPGPARALARELGVAVEPRLSPADKVERLRAAGPGTLFVGDGLNDAAALAAADVGVSMANGSGASLSAARVNLLRPGLAELPDLVLLARAALRTAKLNLAWAFLYNAAGLALAVSGRLTPIFAASAMVASSLVSVLSSSLLQRRARRERPPDALRTVAETAYAPSPALELPHPA